MAINRIKFNTTATSVGAYTVALNPLELELNMSSNYNLFDVIDGPHVIQNKYYDDRPYVMKWKRIPQNFSNLATMLSTLEGYKGSNMYVHFGTADYRVSGTGWTYVRVENLKVDVDPGGSLKYNIELSLLPEIE